MSQCGKEKTSHVIGVCAGAKKDMKSHVDIYIALTGVYFDVEPYVVIYECLMFVCKIGGDVSFLPLVGFQILFCFWLQGTHGRSTPKRLDDRTDQKKVSSHEFVEYFVIRTEPIGEILAATIGVRHRHLTDDWYLRYVTVNDKEKTNERRFPCHSVILSKITLRPGEGKRSPQDIGTHS